MVDGGSPCKSNRMPGNAGSNARIIGLLLRYKYYHIGIAVDTKAGLLVPVLRDVDKKSPEDISKEIRPMHLKFLKTYNYR